MTNTDRRQRTTDRLDEATRRLVEVQQLVAEVDELVLQGRIASAAKRTPQVQARLAQASDAISSARAHNVLGGAIDAESGR